jgi:hypothetical protein
MRAGISTVAIFLLLGFAGCQLTRLERSSSAQTFAASSTVLTAKKPDFDLEIKPIFQARCQPCHFQGGQVYAKLPFDKPETITRLGTKLFTRIKDEKEQRLIREFLAAQ